LFADVGLIKIQSVNDLAGRPRVTLGQMAT